MGGQAPESAPASSARNSGWEAFKAVVLISILALVCATTGLSARTYNIVKHRGWETKISLIAPSSPVPTPTPAPGPSSPSPTPSSSPKSQYLAANSSTVHWGFYSKTLKPSITINSGDTLTVEMITHHAGDYYEGMIKGDPGIEDIYKWGPASGALTSPLAGPTPGTTTDTRQRGATGGGDGVHVLTGPIYVNGAQPGDVLKVEILDLRPRVNPNTKKTFGINAAAWWGYSYGVNGPASTASGMTYKTGPRGPNGQREMTTVYEIITDASGKALYAQPAFRFQYGAYGSIVTPCLAATTFNPGVSVPCVNGTQTWQGYQYPGLITKHPTGTEDYSVAGKWQVPLNFHIGSMGLAPPSPNFVDSIPPMVYGGNLDDRRIGIGATMYYTVGVDGALLSMGDAHTAQGDSELDGTAIETSITGDFRITVIKAGPSMPAFLTDLTTPLLENDNEYIVHGFTYQDYLTELGYADTSCGNTQTGCPTDVIYFKSDVEHAMGNTLKQGVKFLAALGYSEDQAMTMLTTACDFSVTQLVDGNWGAQVNIPKYILTGSQTAPYTQSTTCGGSQKAISTPNPPPSAATKYTLAANASTVHWGYYSKTLTPKLTINSGDTVTVELITHHAGDYYEGMIKGDPGITDIYAAMLPGSTAAPGTTVAAQKRGASGGGDGVHVLTGPIAVNGAQPGDILKVEILNLRPRVNPNTGKTFGINAAAWWGYHYGVNGPLGRKYPHGFPTKGQSGYSTGDPDREMTTVYEVVSDASGNGLYAQPVMQFKYGVPGSIMVPCVGGAQSPILTFNPGVTVPCINGFQNFTGYQYPGLITRHPTGSEDYSVAGAWQIPLNLHIGSMGLAPPSPNFVDSIPPMVYGGNLDNRRLGAGATMYLKVGVAGGLLSMGDAHAAQGDSELDGTGIETSITGDFKITLIKNDATLPNFLKNLTYPLIENANEYVVHGFTFNDYLTELNYATTTGCAAGAVTGCPTNNVYFLSSTDKAVANAYHNSVAFLMNLGYDEDAAISMLSVGCDFGITQVVDGNWGAHVSIPKYMLSPQTTPFVQRTMCKTSMPAASYYTV